MVVGNSVLARRRGDGRLLGFAVLGPLAGPHAIEVGQALVAVAVFEQLPGQPLFDVVIRSQARYADGPAAGRVSCGLVERKPKWHLQLHT